MAGRVAGRAFAHGAHAPWVGRVPRVGARVWSLRPGAECRGEISRVVRVGMINESGARSRGRARDAGWVRCALREMVLLWVLGCEAFARCGAGASNKLVAPPFFCRRDREKRFSSHTPQGRQRDKP